MPRQILSRACRVALVVTFLAAPSGRCQPPQCRDGDCEPHCPVRPGQFGYYPTQWRRWPEPQRPGEKPRDATTPAAPPRSVIPRVDEESPAETAQATPTAAAIPVTGPVAAPVADRRRLELLAAEADAARLADPAAKREFTARLVTAMLSEADAEVRCLVLALAAGFDTPDAESICAGAFADPDPRVRLTACRVCVDRDGPGGVDHLARRAREDADLGVRLRAVRCLGECGDPAAISRLVALLDDPDPAIRSRATAALARATGRNFGTDVDRWRQWAARPESVPPRWSISSVFRSLF